MLGALRCKVTESEEILPDSDERDRVIEKAFFKVFATECY